MWVEFSHDCGSNYVTTGMSQALNQALMYSEQNLCNNVTLDGDRALPFPLPYQLCRWMTLCQTLWNLAFGLGEKSGIYPMLLKTSKFITFHSNRSQLWSKAPACARTENGYQLQDIQRCAFSPYTVMSPSTKETYIYWRSDHSLL